MQNPNLKNLSGLAILSIDMDIWSGQTKLEDTDLELAEDYNRDVVNIGNKRLVGRAALKPFDRIKSATRRQLLRRGIPFLSGYAVPVEQLDEVVAEVESLKLQFDAEVHSFLGTYEANVEAWIAQNPDDEAVIRRGTLPIEAVEKRFQFVWDAFHVESVDNNKARGRLEATAGQLGEKLIQDVQQTARSFWDKNLRGRKQVGVTCQTTLREMKRKLESLRFLDNRCTPLIHLLDGVILQSERAESRNGRNFVDPFFSQLVASVLILADSNRMNEHIEGYEEAVASGEMQPWAATLQQSALFADTSQAPSQAAVNPVNNAPQPSQKPATKVDDFYDALEEIAGIGESEVTAAVPAKPVKETVQTVDRVQERSVEQPEPVPAPAIEAEVPVKAVAVKAEPEKHPQPAEPVMQELPDPVSFGFGIPAGASGW